MSDLSEIERLGCGDMKHSHHPSEITLQGNPVSRKPRYRATLIHVFPSLQVVDGRTVTEDEKERARTVVLSIDT